MAKFRQIREAAKYNPYAIGMAAAKKAAGLGKGPAENLPKSVITKGHEIAKKIKANEEFDVDLTELNESAGDKLLQAAREYKQGSHEYHKGMIKYHDYMADVHSGTPKGNEHEENIRHHRSELAKLKEEAEQVDEISKDLALSYLDKAPKSARIHGMISTDYRNAAERKRNPGLKRALDNLSQKYKKTAWKREAGIKRAITKVAGDK